MAENALRPPVGGEAQRRSLSTAGVETEGGRTRGGDMQARIRPHPHGSRVMPQRQNIPAYAIAANLSMPSSTPVARRHSWFSKRRGVALAENLALDELGGGRLGCQRTLWVRQAADTRVLPLRARRDRARSAAQGRDPETDLVRAGPGWAVEAGSNPWSQAPSVVRLPLPAVRVSKLPGLDSNQQPSG